MKRKELKALGLRSTYFFTQWTLGSDITRWAGQTLSC